MKKVTLNYVRQNENTQWYAMAADQKSQDFLTYKQFIETEIENIEISLHNKNEVTVDLYFTEEKYPQFETLHATVQTELNAYNSANNITITKTVTDV